MNFCGVYEYCCFRECNIRRKRHESRSRRAVRPHSQRTDAPGQRAVYAAGLALCPIPGGKRHSADRGHRLSPPDEGGRCPDGIRSPLAGPGLGRGRLPGRSARTLLSAHAGRAVRRSLSQTGEGRAALPLLLQPGAAPFGQRAPSVRRRIRIRRNLPGAFRRKRSAAAGKEPRPYGCGYPKR